MSAPRIISIVLIACAMLPAADPTPPQQPLPFSHKQHVATGLKCKECHTNPEPGEVMGFPPASKCMACHIVIAKDKPAIQKLKSYADSKQQIPWVRIYQIPGYVEFSHLVHLDAKTTCNTCHGPVEQRDALWKEVHLTMGACMRCHSLNDAPNGCNTCHDPR